MLKKGHKITFFVILLLIACITALSMFGLNTEKLHIKGAADIRFGIDIQGGVEAVFVPKDLDRSPTKDELDKTRQVLENRLNVAQILDREITIDRKNGEVLIRFPWKSEETEFNPQEAIAELGETALLTFRDSQNNVKLDGSHISQSVPASDTQNGGYLIQLTLDSQGTKLFQAVTQELTGKHMGIYMDDTLISQMMVEQKATGSTVQITGIKTMEEAQELSDKINAGALPFSLESKNFSTISPTLGQDALAIMIQAGLAAFAAVSLFMILYYRIPGFVACIGLALQIAFQLLLVSIPQITLTFPGIAGMILSVGMGVDANVITAERIKEEINRGCLLHRAINLGYHRAFSAVFDGNFTTIIVAVILMIFGSNSMVSFSYTLIAGGLLNFLSGILASRLMLLSLAEYPSLNKKFLYGGKANV